MNTTSTSAARSSCPRRVRRPRATLRGPCENAAELPVGRAVPSRGVSTTSCQSSPGGRAPHRFLHQIRSRGSRGTTLRTADVINTTRRNCRRSIRGDAVASSIARQFLLFLETLTGIDNLLPDPYFIGGGLHLSGRGDFLKVHADFNWHHKLQAHRRLNALTYLSDTWDEEWGGAVEFWDKDMNGAVDKAYPIFNRLVVFSTSENSNHGQPEHNKCPEGTYRKVLNLYYYTTAPRRRRRRRPPSFHAL